MPITTSVMAAMTSYAEMAIPSAKPVPDIPINCSAEMLAAINEAPTAHHVRVFPARK